MTRRQNLSLDNKYSQTHPGGDKDLLGGSTFSHQSSGSQLAPGHSWNKTQPVALWASFADVNAPHLEKSWYLNCICLHSKGQVTNRRSIQIELIFPRHPPPHGCCQLRENDDIFKTILRWDLKAFEILGFSWQLLGTKLEEPLVEGRLPGVAGSQAALAAAGAKASHSPPPPSSRKKHELQKERGKGKTWRGGI